MRNSINHNKNDIIVWKDRLTEFEGLRKNTKLKMKSIKQRIKLIKNNKVRCYICKSDIHRASYSIHLKRKEHLEHMTQNKVIVPRKQIVKKRN